MPAAKKHEDENEDEEESRRRGLICMLSLSSKA
jgi:hypothetical protein